MRILSAVFFPKFFGGKIKQMLLTETIYKNSAPYFSKFFGGKIENFSTDVTIELSRKKKLKSNQSSIGVMVSAKNFLQISNNKKNKTKSARKFLRRDNLSCDFPQ